jgi:hypothetical protein
MADTTITELYYSPAKVVVNLTGLLTDVAVMAVIH